MKKTIVIILVVIAGLVAFSIVRDQIIKSVVSVVATQVTGAKVEIKGFSLGIVRQSVSITGFKMYNPKGFSSGILIDIPEVAVRWDLFAILRGKLHLPLVELELKEIVLETNKEGKLNVDSLKVAQQKEPPKASADEKKKPAKPLGMQVDQLNLAMGRMVSKNYSVEPMQTQVFDINFKKSYKNITSVQQLAALILTEPMKQAGVKGAAIYGAAMLTGVGFIPVAIAATFAGKDSVEKNLNVAMGKLYEVSLAVLGEVGKVVKEDKAGGVITAAVSGADVAVKLKTINATTTGITISARKYMMPKQEIASGVLYQISEKLKK